MNTYILYLSLIIILTAIIGSTQKSPNCIPATAPKEKDSCQLPERTTTNPLVFGPILWTTFHLIAAGYHTPNGTDLNGIPPAIYRVNAKKFIESLPFMIPCGHCGFHLHQFIQTRNLDEDIRTKDNFIRFFVEAHNNVTRHVNKIMVNGKQLPPKKLWTLEDAKKKYFCADTCVHDPRVWPAPSGGLWKHIQQHPENYVQDMY